MQKRLTLLISSLLLMLSGSAYAHNGLFAHPETSIEVVHAFLHMLMLLPLAAGVFFLGRWSLRRNQQARQSFSVNKH